MLCEECKEKLATVHLIQVFDGQKNESHLCEACAAQKSGLILDTFHEVSIPNLLGGMFGSIYNLQDVPTPNRPSKCPNCGMSFNDIRRLGKLGCSECYQVYAQELEASLRRIHGNTQHLGKIPLRGGEKALAHRKMENLKNRLLEAVREEQYEKAAEIRDLLKEMERKPT